MKLILSIAISASIMVVSVSCLGINAPCVTQNGEKGTCTTLSNCTSFLNQVFDKCNEDSLNFAKQSFCGHAYESLFCCGSTASPIENVKPPYSKFLPDQTICGSETSDNRIHGGIITDLSEFPWMALLGYQTEARLSIQFMCGGSLINNRYVLTAAHCIRIKPESGLSLEVVRLGEWKISSEEDCDEALFDKECADPVLDLQIEQKIAHPYYSRKTSDNDIGLLRLERNIRYSDYIKPICLPFFNSPKPKVGDTLVISGWGRTENGSLSDYKLKLEVPIVSDAYCISVVKRRAVINKNHICANGGKGKDACQGDSGGPLLGKIKISDSKEIWYQEAITSWGVGCGQDFPGVYTRVSNYMSWILNTMSDF